MLREVMPIIAGGGVGLVLALFPCFYCVRCVVGSRAIDSARWGYGGGGGVPPLVCVALSLLLLLFLVLWGGEWWKTLLYAKNNTTRVVN